MSNDMGLSFLLKSAFPELTPAQLELFEKHAVLFKEWNEKINLVSRKDIDQLAERHILHSLAIAKYIRFNSGAKVMDIGTGGGFPGIPLAIYFPEVEFILVDSIAKKMMVVDDLVKQLGLTNVQVVRGRAEELDVRVDYVVSRATAPMTDLVNWSIDQLSKGQKGSLPNGWVVLKGGDLKEELRPFAKEIEIQNVKSYFNAEYFEGKVIVYLQRQRV